MEYSENLEGNIDNLRNLLQKNVKITRQIGF